MSSGAPLVVPDEDTRDPRHHTAPPEANERHEAPKDSLDVLCDLFEAAVNETGRQVEAALRREERRRYYEKNRPAILAYQKRYRREHAADIAFYERHLRVR